MDSNRLTHWLTLVANLGVVAGILLLIAELNQNRELTRAQTRHELAMGIVDLLQAPAGNPQLAELLFRAQSGGRFSAAEHFQFRLRTNALFRYWEDVHYQYRAGLYDEVEFTRQRDAWKSSLAQSPLGKVYWCEVRTLYSPEFAAEMDAILDSSCTPAGDPVDGIQLNDFAARYTTAWCSLDPARVASFFAEDGVLFVNGAPAVGRAAISAVAREFMTAFPDLVLTMDALDASGGGAIYHWTFAGTNSGPGGTGRAVKFSGYEEWTLNADGLIETSLGHFDAEAYRRQLEGGPEPARP